jgi:carboxymethylenebutenolidase
VDEGMLAETVRYPGHQNHEIPAYLARPLGPGPFPGVLVIHHMPGWDEGTKEITRRFAHHGYAAICPNLHFRDAPDASPDDAAAATRAAGGVSDERFIGDAAAAVRLLRAQPYSSGRVGCIGYCSGGRQSFLAACTLPLDAAVVCYGAFIAGEVPPGLPLKVTPVLERAADITCPVLGLFGAEDTHPAPTEVAQIEAELERLGKEHEFHIYPGAGHSFFRTEGASYNVEAATQGWQRIWEFFGRNLGG